MTCEVIMVHVRVLSKNKTCEVKIKRNRASFCVFTSCSSFARCYYGNPLNVYRLGFSLRRTKHVVSHCLNGQDTKHSTKTGDHDHTSAFVSRRQYNIRIG